MSAQQPPPVWRMMPNTVVSSAIESSFPKLALASQLDGSTVISATIAVWIAWGSSGALAGTLRPRHHGLHGR
jgi:hypothetical protein